MRAIAYLFVLLCALPINATGQSEKTFHTADEFIASLQDSDPKTAMISKGDLSGDGKSDVVVVVGFAGKDGNYFNRTQQLFVLVQSLDGQLVLTASSQRAEIAGMGCCWVEYLEIKNGSFYIQNNAKTACDIESAIHQFKLYHGAWRLVGLNISNYKHCDDPQVTDTLDVNILTGKIINSRQLGERRPRRWVTRFQPKVELLKDYDFFNGFGLLE